MNANVYANFLPLIVLVLALGYGAACLAGQDEDGTLALVAVLPATRRTIVAQKAGTLLLQVLPVPLATLLLVLAGPAFDLGLDTSAALGATAAVVLLGLDFGLLAMLLGALTESRGAALGIGSAVAAASYLISSLSPVTNWMHPLRFVSLFYWAVGNGQLTNGLSITSAAVLTATAAGLFPATIWAFDRLDIH